MLRRKHPSAQLLTSERGAPIRRPFGRVALPVWLGFLGILLIVSLPVEKAGANEVATRGIEASGFRCETRHFAREVVRGNYVLDRSTECRPIVEFSVAAERAAADGERRAAADVQASIAPAGDPATWSRQRRLLRNAQYDRSLRAMKGRFARSPRE